MACSHAACMCGLPMSPPPCVINPWVNAGAAAGRQTLRNSIHEVTKRHAFMRCGRVTLVCLRPGESPQSMPQVVECGHLDLAAETAQQAAGRRVGGAVCSRCIRLHLTQGAELLKRMQHGDEHLDDFPQRMQHGEEQAGAAGAAELATAAAAEAEAARAAEQAAAEAEAAHAAERAAAAADTAGVAARTVEQAAAGGGHGQPSLRSHPLSDVDSDNGSDTEAASNAPRASTTDASGAAAAAAEEQGAAAAAAASTAADRMPAVAGYVIAMCLRQVSLQARLVLPPLAIRQLAALHRVVSRCIGSRIASRGF